MQPQDKRIRAMVVDDSPVALGRMCSCLEEEPAVEVVATAADGAEALSIAEKLRPDLILLDLQMPGMNGLEVASRVAADFPATSVVIVTGFEVPKLGSRLSDWGVRGVIRKQHLSEELRAVLDQMIRLRPDWR